MGRCPVLADCVDKVRGGVRYRSSRKSDRNQILQESETGNGIAIAGVTRWCLSNSFRAPAASECRQDFFNNIGAEPTRRLRLLMSAHRGEADVRWGGADVCL